MNIITGENFQTLSEISFCTERSNIVNNQLAQIPQNLFRINDFSIDDIKLYSKIFCYTDDIDAFLDKFFDYLNDETVLITHNSDNFIDAKYIKYLDSNKIKKWFCQNKYIDHPKLISLPIGIANSQWQHGDVTLLSKIKNENNSKTNLVFKNFNIGTNINDRTHCDNITSNNGMPMWVQTSNEEYWRNISKSVFTIAPWGNGIDSHRIWECLYLKSIPIVQYHTCFSQFKHLPILFINDWNEITPALLNEFKATSSIDFNCNVLYVDYWKELINTL